MSKLLVSIRSVQEAELITRCQVVDIGILDIKEPSRGGLGASDRETLQQIAERVKGSSPSQLMSFSAGELIQWAPLLKAPTANVDSNSKLPDQPSSSPASVVRHYGQQLLSQFDYVKIGLAGVAGRCQAGKDSIQEVFGTDHESQTCWKTAWQRLFDGLPDTTRSVAVVYVDFQDCGAPRPEEVIEFAARVQHCDVVLFDTCYKSGNLFSHVSITELERWVNSARGLGLETVVAGSVNLDCLADVISVFPDFVGVRGAICRGDRVGEVALELVEQFAQSLSLHVAQSESDEIAEKKSEKFTKA